MQREANILGAKLISYFESLEKTRKKLEFAFNKGYVNKRDIEKIYDGLFLNAVGAFENFLEELFIGLLAQKLKVSFRLTPRTTFTTIQAARKVLLGNDSYLKWLPYDITLNLAEIYFVGRNPFTRLLPSELEILRKILCVRNAVAHKSPYALEKFERQVVNGATLPASEKSPSGYLRGNFRSAPSQTRYENYINSLAQMVVKIAK